MEVDEDFVDVVDEVVDDLLDEAEKQASACLLQAGIRGTLERKRSKLERERVEMLQRAWRCRLAKKYLQGLRENAAAVHIQRHVRARLARNEVTALKLQGDAIDEAATILIRRKRTSRFDENKTTLDALTFVKAGDTAGVRQLTKLPGVDLNHAAVELSRPGITGAKSPTSSSPSANKLGAGARKRLERCGGATLKLPSMENELSGTVGQFLQAHVKRPPRYAYDSSNASNTSIGALRVDMRVDGAVFREAAKNLGKR